MGFSVLFLSTRLPTEAYVALLEKTECTRIVAAPKLSPVVAKVNAAYPLEEYPIPDRSIWSQKPGSSTTRFVRQTELLDEENTVAFIVHSSGSTGLPKPIYQTHRQCLNNYAVGSGMRAFVTLPLFHNHGLATMFRGMVAGKRTAIYNANLPLTNGHLVAAMGSAQFESFHCVPYALKVLSESQEGIDQLARAKLVLFGGSSCPDDLGDLLVQNGVNVVSHYGACVPPAHILPLNNRAQTDVITHMKDGDGSAYDVAEEPRNGQGLELRPPLGQDEALPVL